ncbi:Non-specific serine/threonine protein kinase [Bertholletia excelsa]
MLVFILPLFLLSTLRNTETSLKLCEGESYRPGDEENLNVLLKSLASNTSLKRGFYTTSVGYGADIVYGRALCRGDVPENVCKECVQNASQELIQCKKENAIFWYELCQIQYSFQTFSMMVRTLKFPRSNDQEKNVSDPKLFKEKLDTFMKKILERAAYHSDSMFVADKVKFSRNMTIYGLVQCTRDTSKEDCQECLELSLAELDNCCSFHQGGITYDRNCNMRFGLNQFYFKSTGNFPGKTERQWKIWVAVVVPCASVFVLASLTACYIYKNRRKRQRKEEGGRIVTSQELPFMELAMIRAATDNFSDSNKLGQGGFGVVYKGVLPGGKEIAVKRLSRKTWQGIEEFMNEVMLIAKLQHRNLVKLVGCGIEGEEKLLVYEYMPNKSLDTFIFDPEQRAKLDWNARFKIIVGIARGLLYLHEDSRLKIIHRDLKPNNVLLDGDMFAKISDFGMARNFGQNQNIANTRRIVGTYGYMAPEYAMEGLFSVKSDVFSIGVIMLEIITGKKNSGFHLTEHAQSLLNYAWGLWNEGKALELVDQFWKESWAMEEVGRCIHVGLLCVQEDPADRPNISSVIALLAKESIGLPKPKQPAFSVGRLHDDAEPSSSSDPSASHPTFSCILSR